MIKLSTDNTKRQLSIHGWISLLFGFLLYVIVLTGGIVVFEEELSQWSVAAHGQHHPLMSMAANAELGLSQDAAPTQVKSIDSIISQLAAQTPKRYHHKIEIRDSYQGYLSITFEADQTVNNKTQNQTTDQNEQANSTDEAIAQLLQKKQIMQYLVDPVKRQILQVNTDPEQLIDTSTSSWVRFIRNLHTDLYLPLGISRWVVGLFGMMLLIVTISGFLLHRHLIRDLFLAPRRRSSELLKQRDAHNLAGTWSLPFAFLLAFTGAFICFDTRVGLPVVVLTAFDGDAKQAVATLLHEPSVDEVARVSSGQGRQGSEQLYNLDKIIADASSRATTAPDQIVIDGYGGEQTIVTLSHPSVQMDNSMLPYILLFNGNNGEFIREVARIGFEPTVSSNTLRLMYALHFGDFSGWLAKVIWFLSTLILCYVIITGFNLWFERRIKQPSWQRLYVSVPILAYGFPIALMSAALGYFVAYSGGTSSSEVSAIWMGFWIGWLISLGSLGLCFVLQYLQNTATDIKHTLWLIQQYLRTFIIAFALLMPLIRWQVSGQGWYQLMLNHHGAVIVIDMFFLSVALVTLIRWLKLSAPDLAVSKQSKP